MRTMGMFAGSAVLAALMAAHAAAAVPPAPSIASAKAAFESARQGAMLAASQRARHAFQNELANLANAEVAAVHRGDYTGAICLISQTARMFTQSGLQRDGLAPAVLHDMRSSTFLPGGVYTPTGIWRAGNYKYHGTGESVQDAGAAGGRAWQAIPGKDGAAMLFYGPYVHVPRGTYCAIFHLKLLDDPRGKAIGRLDACVAGGADVYAMRSLTSMDFRAGRYAWTPLVFRYVGGALELRCWWAGAVGIRLDQVRLYRVRLPAFQGSSPQARLDFAFAEASKSTELRKSRVDLRADMIKAYGVELASLRDIERAAMKSGNANEVVQADKAAKQVRSQLKFWRRVSTN